MFSAPSRHKRLLIAGLLLWAFGSELLLLAAVRESPYERATVLMALGLIVLWLVIGSALPSCHKTPPITALTFVKKMARVQAGALREVDELPRWRDCDSFSTRNVKPTEKGGGAIFRTIHNLVPGNAS